MRVIARKTLRDFWERGPQFADSKGPLEAWFAEAVAAQWRTPMEVKDQFKNASILKSGRVVFNIGGNKYRLVVAIHYRAEPGIVFVRFIGTHAEYDEIDAETC
jgi:mRNA interferase HigB